MLCREDKYLLRPRTGKVFYLNIVNIISKGVQFYNSCVIAKVAGGQQKGSQYNRGVVSQRVKVIYYKCRLRSKVNK